MKIQIELDPTLTESIVTIHTPMITDEIKKIQTILSEREKTNISFYKDNIEFYLPLDDILFFETTDNFVVGHSKNDTYQVKLKLYELEALLPRCFLRISKSTIVNVKHVYSINKNITSYSLIKFYNSHKQIYVSRLYYKSLKDRLEERRFL